VNPQLRKLPTGRRTGRSLPEGVAQANPTGGGKSELRRAVCRRTSGTWASNPADGQCDRKDTASATPPRFFGNGRRASLEPPAPSPKSRACVAYYFLPLAQNHSRLLLQQPGYQPMAELPLVLGKRNRQVAHPKGEPASMNLATLQAALEVLKTRIQPLRHP
jgi:hypothetical protein